MNQNQKENAELATEIVFTNQKIPNYWIYMIRFTLLNKGYNRMRLRLRYKNTNKWN